jgi:glycosyltransferase involved in cell wall biosynthesis
MSWHSTLEGYKSRAVERIKSYYSWDSVADAYEAMFFEMISGS